MNSALELLAGLPFSLEGIFLSASAVSYLAIFLAILFFGEVAIFIALMLAQQGDLGLGYVFFLGTAAALTADLFWFLVGRYVPDKVPLNKRMASLFEPIHAFLSVLIKDRFFTTILSLKFLIGVRLIIILFLARQPISVFKFLYYDLLGTVTFVSVLTVLSFSFGIVISEYIPAYRTVATVLVGILFFLFLGFVIKRMILARIIK